jgi:N-acetylmuramic acid 6-phosphate etherase
VTGPELVSGSTRMNAGTAQKCAFNMLSTLTAMKLHHVYDGMMVNVRAENAKLRDRAARIVARAAAVDEGAARASLAATDGAVKAAVLVARGSRPGEADLLLNETGGDLRAALDRLSEFPDGRAGA